MANSFLYWKAGKGRNLPKLYKERLEREKEGEKKERELEILLAYIIPIEF